MIPQHFQPNPDQDHSPEDFSSPGREEMGFTAKFSANTGYKESNQCDDDRCVENIYPDESKTDPSDQGIDAGSDGET